MFGRKGDVQGVGFCLCIVLLFVLWCWLAVILKIRRRLYRCSISTGAGTCFPGNNKLAIIMDTKIHFMENVNPDEMEIYFKNETLPHGGDCLQDAATFDFNQEQYFMNIPLPYNTVLPDSTESYNLAPVAPISTGSLPSMEDFSGPCNFNIEITMTADDNKYTFSKYLNKLYVLTETKVPLKFKWNQTEDGLYVRVLPVFLAQDFLSAPVLRCPVHVSVADKSNKDFPYVDHIIRCDHSGTRYDKNSESKRLSTLVPLDKPQAGADGTTMMFTFMCRNSCSLGMNRRKTAVIFTLERCNGEVLGRRVIEFRTCSCPKRDMSKDEKEMKMSGISSKGISEEETDRDFKSNEKKSRKRPAKEMEDLHIKIEKSCVPHILHLIRQSVLMKAADRPLTPEETITVKDCDMKLQNLS